MAAGKQWHAPKKAFRPGSGLTSFETRSKDRIAMATMKAKEKEMKDEKEATRQVCYNGALPNYKF
jgi:rRNA-processing protein CGR1